jgi:hypothetical protein
VSGTDEPVVIVCHVEVMQATTERAEIPRAEWDAMTPAQRQEAIDRFGAEVLADAGGYGVQIESGAPDSDLP